MSWADKVWTVSDVMVEDVVTVTPETHYRRLVELLWTYGISGLPVVDGSGRVAGIVSEADLLRSGVAGPGGSPPPATSSLSSPDPGARDLMTSPVVTTAPDATLTDAASVMRERDLKRLPVVDAGGRLVGIVSRADLLKVFLRSEDTLLWDVEDILQRALVSPGTVSVSTAGGVVRLSGAVESAEQAERIRAAVAKLAGVVGVESHLTWPAAVV